MESSKSSIISQVLGTNRSKSQKPVYTNSDLDLLETQLRTTSVTKSDASSVEESSFSSARNNSFLFSENGTSPPPPLPASKVISSVDAPEGGKICTVRKPDGRLQMRIEYSRDQMLKFSESPICVIPPASIREMVLETPEILAPFPVRHGLNP